MTVNMVSTHTHTLMTEFVCVCLLKSDLNKNKRDEKYLKSKSSTESSCEQLLLKMTMMNGGG